MWNFKKRLRKDKKKVSSSNTGGEPQATPSTSSNSITLAPASGENSQAAEPSEEHQQLHSSLGTSSRPTTTLRIPERSRSPSANRLGDPLGLTLVHRPKTPPPVDIIFVHGLGGTSRATWSKGRDPEYCWPEKWLPLEPEIRTARILSFGYNANFAATGPRPITGITDFAKDLLFCMKFAKGAQLEELDIGQRPIIFVVHSMGGLVVKQAYILGQNDVKYSAIVSSISAILFLATPHRGSNLAEILNRILTVSVFGHKPKLYVSELENGSQSTQAINEQFRHVAPKLDIFSFYETLQTAIGPKKLMVVEKTSATLGYPSEISKSLDADHHTICKFDSIHNSNYISIRNALKTLVSTAHSRGRHHPPTDGEAVADKIETLLAVTDDYQEDYQFFRRRWTAGTCGWIFSNQLFNEWADDVQGSKVLWIHALPASGKSILSSFIVNHLLEKSFCVYFFFRFGDQAKRSLSTCLRVIAFQIAERIPQFRLALAKMRLSTKTLENAEARTIWEKVFVGILFKMSLSTTTYWVVDALDESDNPQLLVELLHGAFQSTAPMKVLLVSRQTPELISSFDRLPVEVPRVPLPLEDTKKDIRVCVEKEVQYMRATVELKSQIVEKLVVGAAGNFLWASLALAEVMMCHTQEDIDETLESNSRGMETLYERMEQKVLAETRPRDQRLGQAILTWATCSRRPLVLEELGKALQPEFTVILDLKFTMNRVCGQFVVVDPNDQLVMVHQTARDHITASRSALAVNVAEGHVKLFAKCLSVLAENSLGREVGRRSGDQKATENEFAHYAITSWPYHLAMTPPESDAPTPFLINFLKESSVFSWIESLASSNQLKVLADSSRCMLSYVHQRRARNVTTNPFRSRPQELDIIQSWARDFLKLCGGFVENLMASPASIYQQIPPFCPKSSAIYRQFEQHSSRPHYLTVGGLSTTGWDAELARLSLGPGSHAAAIACSADHVAVATVAGQIILYNSETFEAERTLMHPHLVCAMRFSSCSRLLATCGERVTKVWSVKTGHTEHEVRNHSASKALTISFSAENRELIIGSDDCLIRIAKLTEPNPNWSTLHPALLRDGTALGTFELHTPWRVAFSPDTNCVAVSFQSFPLSVWSLDPPELIGRCMRKRDDASKIWTVVHQVMWQFQSEEVIGVYEGGYVFRWNPRNGAQRELQADASTLASSADGKFFAAVCLDNVVKLYEFHQFTLVSQLSCEQSIRDICFSPDGRRLCDARGQSCDIWELSGLVQENEHDDNESRAENGAPGVPTLAISGAVAETQDTITAIAIQIRGRYQATGNKAGVVSLVDTADGDHIAVELWRSPHALLIQQLDWSYDGNYLACLQVTGRVVVKRVQLESNQRWTTDSVFEVKLEARSDGTRQVLLNSNGKAFLVKNGSSVTVLGLRQLSKSESAVSSLTSPSAKWVKHATNSRLLLSFDEYLLRLHLWDDLSEVALFNMDTPDLVPSLGVIQVYDRKTTLAKTDRVFAAPSASHFLVYTEAMTAEASDQLTYLLEIPDIEQSSATITSQALKGHIIPPEIQQEIEIFLGFLPHLGMVFLDKDFWVCSYSVGANFTTRKLERYFFLPKDWVNKDFLKFCTLLADGTILMPKNTDFAVIKCTGMMSF